MMTKTTIQANGEELDWQPVYQEVNGDRKFQKIGIHWAEIKIEDWEIWHDPILLDIIEIQND